MRVVEISQSSDSIVLHFQTDDARINAYTLAGTLVALADAAKAANAALNAGSEIEVVVEALGPGSFRALIRTIYKSSKNLFSTQGLVTGLVIGVLGNYIYERTLSVDNKVVVEIKTDEVVIKRGDDRVVVPRAVYDATRKVERSPQFVDAMNRTFGAASKDEKIKGLGLVDSMDSPPPDFLAPREALVALAAGPIDEPESRTINERAELQITRAILKKSARKWEFVWRGITISAPILDEHFYRDFFAHHITLAPGDTLAVTLSIKQTKAMESGVYVNSTYEVIEVHEHVPRIRQLPLQPE